MKKIILPLIIIVLYGCGTGGEINNSTITSSSIMSSSSTENTSSAGINSSIISSSSSVITSSAGSSSSVRTYPTVNFYFGDEFTIANRTKDWAQPLFYVNDNTLSGIGTLTIILSNTNSSENNIKKVELYIESYLISVNYSPPYYLYVPWYGFGLGKYKIYVKAYYSDGVAISPYKIIVPFYTNYISPEISNDNIIFRLYPYYRFNYTWPVDYNPTNVIMVYIAGEFNNWSPSNSNYKFNQINDHYEFITNKNVCYGGLQYKFVIYTTNNNGSTNTPYWMFDRANPNITFDGFGNYNSIIP